MPEDRLRSRKLDSCYEIETRRGARFQMGIPYGNHGGLAALMFTDMTTSPSRSSDSRKACRAARRTARAVVLKRLLNCPILLSRYCPIYAECGEFVHTRLQRVVCE